jgi:hypothetical protein
VLEGDEDPQAEGVALTEAVKDALTECEGVPVEHCVALPLAVKDAEAEAEAVWHPVPLTELVGVELPHAE